MPEPLTQILEVKSELSEVERANDVLVGLWFRHKLPEDFEAPVAICLEEVLSNVIRHGCGPDQDCDIKVRYSILDQPRAGIEVEVSDSARAFDPLSLPSPDITLPIELRKPGGLGIFLTRKLMDEVRYEYRDGRNSFLFRKHWDTQPAP